MRKTDSKPAISGPTRNRCGIPTDLPDSTEWPNHPVYIRPEGTTRLLDGSSTFALGKAVEFETNLFRGKAIIRLKSVTPNAEDGVDVDAYEAYFEGKKRLHQMVIQGHFKESMKFDEVYFGDSYEKPFKGIPTGMMIHLLEKFMCTINPGMIFDISSDRPRVLSLAGSCQAMSIDALGEEPDMTSATGIVENINASFGTNFKTAAQRRSYLSKPKNACKHTIDKDLVYTFEVYDHTMNIGTYHQHAMGLKIDLTKSLNGQALALSALTKDNRSIFRFALWHERLIESMQQDENPRT